MTFEWYKYYDEYIERICPNYDTALNKVLINVFLNGRIVELGCGTGNLTLKLAKKFKNTKIIAIDKDLKLLNICKKKTKELKNIVYLCDDILNFDFQENDIIVSSLTFHLLDEKTRTKLFDKLCKAKVKQVVIFDRVVGEHITDETNYRAYWQAFINKNNLPSELVAELFSENQINTPDKLSTQISFFAKRNYSYRQVYKIDHCGFIVYFFAIFQNHSG